MIDMVHEFEAMMVEGEPTGDLTTENEEES